MSEKIVLDGLRFGGNAQEFAALYNALLDAKWDKNSAARFARDVVGSGIKIECDCKK